MIDNLIDGVMGAAGAKTPDYIEDVFSTYLYTGTGAAQTITNGIDLSTKGGLVWFKRRNTTSNHRIYDTARGMVSGIGGSPYFYTNTNNGNLGTGFDASVTSTTTGFNITQGGIGDISDNGGTYVSWTFRKQPKFLDIVTYTGTGGTQAIAHNLGSVPGCIMIKAVNSTEDWNVYHRSTGAQTVSFLNLTSAASYSSTFFPTEPTSTQFYVGDNVYQNSEGSAYIAYIFAHNAGGFGLTGTDNVISCGSYTGNGSATGPVIDLGYEPQWIMTKRTDAISNWTLFDNMRGIPVGSADAFLYANTTAAELSLELISPTATGFSIQTTSTLVNASGGTYIYIAIRRGPMRVPTSGTSVYYGTTRTGNGTSNTVSVSDFSPDLAIAFNKGAAGNGSQLFDRLRGGTNRLQTSSTGAEVNITPQGMLLDFSKAYKVNSSSSELNKSGDSYVDWLFARAPGFFDVVCYTGVGGTATFSHNLTVIPELLIIKRRSGVSSWPVLYNFVGSNFDKLQGLNQDGGAATNTYTDGAGLGGAPTSTTFTVDSTSTFNGSGSTFLALLFATCAGVSKVGSFSYATGSSTNVDCGFTSGARFVLLKQTDGVDDWYVWDTARGINAGNDPFLTLNSTAAENSSFDGIDPYSPGFTIPAGGLGTGNFIFLAIA
jgi:hypothetical protein